MNDMNLLDRFHEIMSRLERIENMLKRIEDLITGRAYANRTCSRCEKQMPIRDGDVCTPCRIAGGKE